MTILKPFSLFFALFLFLSCNDDEQKVNPDLVGTWHLIEQYADPGDGSGDYEAIESDRMITFDEDGTFSANGNMCGMNGETTETITGTYDEENGMIEVEDCAFVGFGITFEIKEGHLFIYYPCIEGCGQKYEKAD